MENKLQMMTIKETNKIMETDGGLVITGPAIVGGLIVVGFGGLGLYLGSK
ncbi:TPA: hypothetical protein U0431_000785 [Streptococcus suis]|nr:hypothetical protein [Streptococcus suis]HEM2548014.1 hypothetical protein [Streptococcus suis]